MTEEEEALAALSGGAFQGNSEVLQASEAATPPADLKHARRRRAAQPEAGRIDRLPPHNFESEQAVLGCVLLSPNECLGQCIEKIGETGEAFYDLRHQEIYEEFIRMFNMREPIDIIQLQQRLKNRQMLEQVGGITYLDALQDAAPSAANLSFYLNYVHEKFLLRKTISVCTDVVGRIYDFTGESAELFDGIERDFMEVTARRIHNGARPIGDGVNETLETIEAYHQGRGAPGAIPTGFTDLDRMMLGGPKPGDMIVIAARPSMGKTSLAMNIAENIAIANRIPVGVFSLEMTYAALNLRIICSRARVSLRNVTEGYLAESDFPRLTHAAGQLRHSPLYIDDTPAISVLQLRSKARRMMQQYGIRLFVIDYLQLMVSLSKRAKENRQIEISEISSGIKALAKELNVPIIVLAQLNRDLEREKRKPRMSDLRESGAIEQDADLIGFLYKPAPPDAGEEAVPLSTEECDAIPVNLLVAKQRNGPTGDIFLTFIKGITRFESAARVSDEDIPPEAQQTEFNNA